MSWSLVCEHFRRRAVSPAATEDGRNATTDQAETMRSTYQRINAGDIDGFGDLVAEAFVEHQGEPGSRPRRKALSTSSEP